MPYTTVGRHHQPGGIIYQPPFAIGQVTYMGRVPLPNGKLRKVEIPLLRRVIRWANQQHQASLTFDKVEAQRKEQKHLLKEEQLSAAKASERDAQLSMKLHNDLTDSCCYKVG